MNPTPQLGQIWRRRDPSGATQDFRIVGFQPNPVCVADTSVRGRLASGKRVIIARSHLEHDTERFQCIDEAPADVADLRRCRKDKPRPASSWPHPTGTPVILRLDDGTEVQTRTRSDAWNLAGGRGVVQLEHPHSPWCLSRVRLDKSRMLGNVAQGLMEAVCAATVEGRGYRSANGTQARTIDRMLRRGFLRRQDGVLFATGEAFAFMSLDPKTGRSTLLEREGVSRRRAS